MDHACAPRQGPASGGTVLGFLLYDRRPPWYSAPGENSESHQTVDLEIFDRNGL